MPIKRNEHLKAISREHHHGLLLCWKIKAGLKKEINPERIKTYVDWFYTEHILPHFDIEEKCIFPILGNEHELVQTALSQHQNLKKYFESKTDFLDNLKLIEKELDEHIRFEERVLFNEIQSAATEAELLKIKEIHTETAFADNISDPFWM